MIMKRDIFRRLTISVLLVATPLSVAGAADLPLKSPLPSPMPVATWTGCYIGGNAGEAWVSDTSIVLEQLAGLPLNDQLGTASGSGWAYGGQIGCDYQVNNGWVFGLRAMWDGAHVSGNTSGVVGTGSFTPSFT